MSKSAVDGVCEHLDGCKLDVEKISDEDLFKQPPPKEDCPICFERIPTLHTGSKYKTCCGKVICSGCSYARVYDNQGNEVVKRKCPFCRMPTPSTDEEAVERTKKRVEEANDPIAIGNLGCFYRDGTYGLSQDYGKALQLWHRAAELGYSNAYYCIAHVYQEGRGVEVDKKKARYYYEQAAMRGYAVARHNLGVNEENAGNIEKALRHYMIAVRGGYAKSLEVIKQMYIDGLATKDDYTRALRLYQEYLGEIKSPQRDKAAAINSKKYQYY